MTQFYIQLSKQYDPQPDELYPSSSPVVLLGIVAVESDSPDAALKAIGTSIEEGRLKEDNATIQWNGAIPEGAGYIEGTFVVTETVFSEADAMPEYE